MVMKHRLNYCPPCFPDLKQAFSEGFVQNFQFLQTGLLYLPLTKKLYDFDEITVIVTCCKECLTSRYRVTTKDGIKGIAIEF
jgi:hypothetical protein